MSTASYRGVVRDGTVVFSGGKKPLTDGTEVLVTPVPNPCGSGAAIIAALDKAPPVPAEWMDELEQLTAQGGQRAVPADQSK